MNDSTVYEAMTSPLGEITIFAKGDALSAIGFTGQRYAPSIGSAMRRDAAHPAIVAARRQLNEYFAGKRTTFDLPLAGIGTSFQRAVWKAIGGVCYGETIAYRELARRAGRAGAIRAAGAATGRNPWAIVVPCHRIVGSDGSLTGYAGGLDRKRALLAMETTPAQAPLVLAA